MKWWEWVFSGIGVLALGLFIDWLRRRLRSSGRGATLTAQGARVSDSPVASGSGITQNISETHHYHYGPIATQPTPTAQPATEPRKYIEPIPNVRYIGAEPVLLQEERMYGGGLFEADGSPNALIIRFANEVRQNPPNLTARVKAVLIYRWGQNEIDVAGNWLSEASDVSEFAPDSRRHKLIAGVMVNGQFGTITGQKIVTHRRTWYLSDRLDLKDFKDGILVVQLTDVMRGTHLLYNGEFVISANPLSISPKTV